MEELSASCCSQVSSPFDQLSHWIYDPVAIEIGWQRGVNMCVYIGIDLIGPLPLTKK